jgi:hypothetical protein
MSTRHSKIAAANAAIEEELEYSDELEEDADDTDEEETDQIDTKGRLVQPVSYNRSLLELYRIILVIFLAN